MEPDPGDASAPDLDFSNALHAGPQMLRICGEPAFDPEHVAAGLSLGNRSDLVYHERQRFVWQCRDNDFAGLTDLDLTDFALVHTKDDAIGIQRRHLEQDLAALDRTADQLGMRLDTVTSAKWTHIGLVQ